MGSDLRAACHKSQTYFVFTSSLLKLVKEVGKYQDEKWKINTEIVYARANPKIKRPVPHGGVSRRSEKRKAF